MIGLITLVVGKRVWSAKLPFGPYLAFGALAGCFLAKLFCTGTDCSVRDAIASPALRAMSWRVRG